MYRSEVEMNHFEEEMVDFKENPSFMQ